MTKEYKKTNCHFCGYLCAFTATVEDGKVTELVPDPTRYPYDPQILAGCRRWRMNLDVLDGPDRLNHPLKRCGERGEGCWERISWDEALDEIAEKLASLKERYGGATLASMIGGPHASFWPLHRFMSLFGSPNNLGIGQICWNPRIWMDTITFGWTIEPDITDETRSLFIWGTNPAESDNSAFWRSLLKIHKKGSTKLVVVDPRYTKTARLADLWLAPRPGTDCYLLLALIHVILEEELYDADFVEQWCYGFQELKEHVRPYSPQYVSTVCDVAAEDIATAARLIADAPSALISGRGIDQIGANVAPSHRARCILLAITGNIDRPGASVLLEASDFTSELELECTQVRWDELASACLNTGVTPLQSYEGYEAIFELTSRLDRQLPARYLTSAHPDLALKAMETGKPYPITALIVEATNPLLTYADTHRVYEALMGLELIVVMDYYMTPMAALADYVLPSAGAIERATFQAHGGVANIVYGGDKACEPYYERKNDHDIFRELGSRLGQQEYWPDGSFEEASAHALARAGMSWEEYCQQGIYAKAPLYHKHLMVGEDGTYQGFATESGKIELVSLVLEKLGGDRLPLPRASCCLCSAGFIAQKEQDGWHHVELITGGRKQPYNASMYFNNASFRSASPAPLAEMSPATADALGLLSGDTVVLATEKGEARFIVATMTMRDGLVHADYGWWHPEWDIADGRLGGIWESNVNTLTSCSLDQAEKMIGTWSYNAIDCMVKKADEALVREMPQGEDGE